MGMLTISLILMVILFFIFGKSSTDFLGGWLLLILVFVGMTVHLAGTWWVLYQFAITRKRMSNKLHLFNRVSVIVSLVLSAVYLGFGLLLGLEPSDDVRLLEGIVAIVLMGLYIFYQENNTNNFLVVNLHMKMKVSKKEYNQMIGFLIGWIGASLLWLLMAAGLDISFMSFFYIVLILVQNGLSYTTYGQSKQWNFTYEVVLISHLIGMGLAGDYIILTVIGLVMGLVLCFRQWITNAYSTGARIVGFLLYLAVAVVFVLKHNVMAEVAIPLLDAGSGLTESMLAGVMLFFLTFAVAFVIKEPTFLKGLSTK